MNILSSAGISATIQKQKDAREPLRIFAKPKAVRKAIKKSDVSSAVLECLDGLDREFRRLSVEFPRFRDAYDTARVVVKNARPKA